MNRLVILSCFLLLSCGLSAEKARKDLNELGISYNENSLRLAGQQCDELVVDKFLATEMSPEPALLGAAESSCLKLVQKLINKVENSEFKDLALLSVTHIKSQPNDLEIAKVLLESGVNPNKEIDREYLYYLKYILGRKSNSYSYLQGAIYKQNLSLINLLLDNKAEVNDFKGTHSYAIYTAAGISSELTQLLLDKGANPDSFSCDYTYCSPLLAATKNNDLSTVTLLLENGANPNDSEDKITSPSLVEAVERKNLEIVRKLVEAGANVNDADGKKSPSLIRAISLKNNYSNRKSNNNQANIDIIKYLLSKGANPDSFTCISSRYKSSCSLLASAASYNDLSTVTLLLEKGANPNDSEDKITSLSLVEAVKRNDLEIVKKLVEAGANVNDADGKNSSALTQAFSSKNYREKDYNWEIIEYLLSKGAQSNSSTTNIYSSRNDFLGIALDNEKYDLAKILVSRGVEVNTIKINNREDKSSPALINAVNRNNFKQVQILLELGANPNSTNRYVSRNCNILSVAIHKKYDDIARLLKSYNATVSNSDNEFYIKRCQR